MIEVFIAEYLGEGYWADYPPYEFKLEECDKAKRFVVSQMGYPNIIVREVRCTSPAIVANWEAWS